MNGGGPTKGTGEKRAERNNGDPLQSISVDKGDRKAVQELVHHQPTQSRGRIEISTPMFFTRSGAPLPLCGQFINAYAFLLAGGPSAGELDLQRLRSCWTMTLNNAHHSFRGNANCTVDDPSRFNMSMWLDPTVLKFTPASQFRKKLWDNRCVLINGRWVNRWEPSTLAVADCPNVVGYQRNDEFNAQRWLYEETINWGNNARRGGGRSVLLSALRILFLLGFRRVYLLGVDFQMNAEKRYHFPEIRHPGAIRGNTTTYTKLEEWFQQLQPRFLDEGFIVKNCNSTSRLTAFPFIDYEEALAEAMAPLGDPTREQTIGMYQDGKIKAAEAEQASSSNSI